MAGDYTRLRFDPRNDGAGIPASGGTRHARSGLERAGRTGPPTDPRWHARHRGCRRGAGPIPEGFHIQLSATNDLTIGVGRIYVDGLLAENHADRTGSLRREARPALRIPHCLMKEPALLRVMPACRHYQGALCSTARPQPTCSRG